MLKQSNSAAETTIQVSNPIGLTELSASLEALTLGTDPPTTIVQRTQTLSPMRGKESTGSPEKKDSKKTLPSPGSKPRRYALEMWLEIEVGPGLFTPPEDDSFSVDYAMEAVNRAYPGCTGVYLGSEGHMLIFYGQKGSTRTGLTQDVAVEACRAVSQLPTWMGFTARWTVRCVSLAEANDTLAGCKRLEKENQRRERLYYQGRITSMQQFSHLSPAAVPFQPKMAQPPLRLVDATGIDPGRESDRSGAGFSPPRRTPGSFRGRSPSSAHHSPSQVSDDGDLPTNGDSTDDGSRKKKRRSKNARDDQSVRSGKSTHGTGRSTPSGGGRRKKDGFSSKIQIPTFGGNKGHADDVIGAFRQWARCITYYREYYEESYLMPLVVSSLTGDASDVFDWIHNLNPEKTEDLATLLQMLREHYCGSLTFREQRNLKQKPKEAAIDFLIRVGTSVSILGRDWKGRLTPEELRSLQLEISLNGVNEHIRHVLDSEEARQGPLSPQQMYEAVKKYEAYLGHSRRMDDNPIKPRAPIRTPAYQPRFHKTTAFAATVGESEDDTNHPPEPPPTEEANSPEAESS